MATIKGTFDADLLKRIIDDQKAKAPEVKKKAKKVKKIEIESGEGEQPFSVMFGWKPKLIPDIPVHTWEVEDWHEAARIMIPSSNPHWVWPKEATELFALAMYCDDTTLLHGLQGTGKSELPAQWCAKFNIPMWRMSCHEETREVHFLGSPGVEYGEGGNMSIRQEPTLLTDSLKYGGFFVEDEAFRHSAALVLQSLREKNTRSLVLPDAPGRTANERVLKADPQRWRYILTDNTSGSGDTMGVFQAQVQDASTLDRITATIEVEYLDKGSETTIIKNHSPNLDEDVVENMIAFAALVRSAFTNQAMLATFSVRALLAWAEKIELLGSVKEGLRISWFSKLVPDDRAKAADMYHQVFAEKL